MIISISIWNKPVCGFQQKFFFKELTEAIGLFKCLTTRSTMSNVMLVVHVSSAVLPLPAVAILLILRNDSSLLFIGETGDYSLLKLFFKTVHVSAYTCPTNKHEVCLSSLNLWLEAGSAIVSEQELSGDFTGVLT